MILHDSRLAALEIAGMTDRTTDRAEYRGEALAVRSIIGGALMGLANLVPGISGGTMLLAVGVYPQFITGVAEVSTFRFRAKNVLMLLCVVGAAFAAIVTLAGFVGEMVVEHRWIMYSLFIGLTLGGVPVLWKMIKPADPVIVLFSIVGIALMAAIAMIDPENMAQAGDGRQYALLFLAGLVAGSAMILPGLSGGYLLLVLGQYVTILTAIAAAREHVSDRDWSALAEPMHVFIPVGIGALVGVVGVSNLVKLLLVKCERPTLGVLMGLLLGAVIGLWPFVDGVAPEVGTAFRGDLIVEVEGQLVMQSSGRVVEARDFPTQPFTPGWMQVVGALALALAGFLVSTGIAHLGARAETARNARPKE